MRRLDHLDLESRGSGRFRGDPFKIRIPSFMEHADLDSVQMCRFLDGVLP